MQKTNTNANINICLLCNKSFKSALLMKYHIKNKDCIKQVCDVIQHIVGLNNTYTKKYLTSSYENVYDKYDINTLEMLKMFTISDSITELKTNLSGIITTDNTTTDNTDNTTTT